MGQVKIERWQCDRCGALEKERPWVGHSRRLVHVRNDFGETTYTTVEWIDLCRNCNTAVEKEVEAMVEAGRLAREAASEKRLIQLG